MSRFHLARRNWKIVGIALSILVFIGHFWLPPKRLLLHPSAAVVPRLYGFDHPVDGPSGRWIDQASYTLLCDYRAESSWGCGINLLRNDDFMQGTDLRGYSGALVDVQYEGPADRVRFALRNVNPAYTKADQNNSTNFMAMTITTEEVNLGQVYVDFSELSVAEWWLKEDQIRNRWTANEFDRISTVGFDFVSPGYHKLRVNRVEIIGRWIGSQTLSIILIGVWMAIFLFEGCLRLYRGRQRSLEKLNQVQGLRRSRQALNRDKESLRQLSNTDPLTNLPNRGGIIEYFGLTRAAPLGLLVIDFDHFKSINDRFGHDLGDAVLKHFAVHIALQLRAGDCFGRWGGETFVLLTQVPDLPNPGGAIENLAEKIRLLAQHLSVPQAAEFELTLTVSLGATLCRAGEAFDEAFKRAEAALHEAKQLGRDRVAFQA